MKTKGISSSNRLWLWRAGLIALLWVGQVLGTQGQIFIANYTSGTISEYSTGGALINAALISGLTDPISLALDGNGLPGRLESERKSPLERRRERR